MRSTFIRNRKTVGISSSMKCGFVILSVLVISTSIMARPQQSSQYGVPQQQRSSFNVANSEPRINPNFGQSFANSGVFNDGPKVYKHISIHVAPAEDFQVPMKRIIRPMEKPDKIVNIIFVKAPSHSSNQQTEVILPTQPQTKTVVYVLLKRPGNNSNIKIRQPKPTTPSKPAVFFIKYGKNNANQGQQESSGGGVDADEGSGTGSYGVSTSSSHNKGQSGGYQKR